MALPACASLVEPPVPGDHDVLQEEAVRSLCAVREDTETIKTVCNPPYISRGALNFRESVLVCSSMRKLTCRGNKGRHVEPPGKGDIKIYHCPFQRLEEVAGIKPNSVNLVLTDIPYGQEFLPQVGELAAFAARVLAEGGLLVTYTGQFWLPKIIASFEPHLNYRCVTQVSGREPETWRTSEGGSNGMGGLFPSGSQSCSIPKGSGQRRESGLMCRWLRPRRNLDPWQEPLEEVERLVKDFSQPGDQVVDPLGGAFTTAVACKRHDRKSISCDNNEAAIIRGQDRLAGKRSDEHPALSSIGSPSNTELLLVMVRRLEVLEGDIWGTELGEDDRNLIDRAIEVLRRLQDVATRREVVA